MRSQLTAQFMPFFRLIARILTFRDRKYRILTFCDKKFRILTFCDKTELYLTVLQQNNVEACSLWLSLALSGSLLLALALSGSLLLSEFAYNILARLTRPLLSSQRRCCAATLYAALLRGVDLRSVGHSSQKLSPKKVLQSCSPCILPCIAKKISMTISGQVSDLAQISNCPKLPKYHESKRFQSWGAT